MSIPTFTAQDYDLVEITQIDPTIHLDIRYATKRNFTEKQVYSSNRCFLRRIVADRLHHIQNKLRNQGLGLNIFDGYRPFYIQEIFWKIHPDQRYIFKPVRASNGTPIAGSNHSRGVAVDLSLINLTSGQELEMPSEYDDFSEKAHRTYETMTKAAREHCKLLEKLMITHDFEPQPKEWWHFDLAGWQAFDLLDIDFDQINSQQKKVF